MGQVTVFEPYGTVELVDSCADDLSVVNAARVSFAKASDIYSDSDAKLLRFLMAERHGTPFEHNYMRFRVRAPIFVFWDWKRHRIASYNVESARYIELRPHFFIPEFARAQVGKPGAYTFNEFPGETDWLQTQLQDFSDTGYRLYREAIDRGIAKEQARLFIPMNLYVEFIFSVNARSLMNFLSLRNEPNAIYEIQKYAEALEGLWKSVMPDTAQAFIDTGRVSP